MKLNRETETFKSIDGGDWCVKGATVRFLSFSISSPVTHLLFSLLITERIGEETALCLKVRVSSNPAKIHVIEPESLTLAGINAAEDKETLTVWWKVIL